jgi:phenylacetate-CoA ligase
VSQAEPTDRSEQLRAERVADLMSRLADGDDVDRLTWPLERLWDLRDRRLRELIAHAKEHSPWHAERLAGVEPEDVDAEGLRDLPAMDKRDLMEAWDSVSTDPRLTLDLAKRELDDLPEEGCRFVLDQYLVMSTSGSSGVPTVVAWDLDGWTEMAAVVMRAGMWLQRQAAGDGAPAAMPSGAFVQAAITSPRETSMSRQLAAFLRNPMVEDHPIPARTPLPQMVEAIDELSPSGVFGYASALAMLAGEAKAGRLRARPAMIGTSSEPLLSPMRGLLREGFGIEPSDTFAVTEIGALVARTFPGEPGLRLAEDIAVYEVDESGALLVTNVLNRALPLIRYRVGDHVRIDSPGDAVPWTGRRITITDTSGAVFTLGDARVEASAVAAAIECFEFIVDYSVAQTGAGIAVLAWTPLGHGDGALEAVSAELRHALARAGAEDAAVEVSFVDDPARLPQTDAGKRRRFVLSI